MAQVTVTILAIGQGVASLLEVWEGASYGTRTNYFVALMDCGSDDNKAKPNVVNSVAAIREAMSRHSAGTGFAPPYLDMLLISHQDKDHWDKLDLVFENVQGRRQVNYNGTLVDTCIQKPAEIGKLNFMTVGAEVLASQEQYSNFNTSFGAVLYTGSQHLLIGIQDYYTNVEWSYSDITGKALHTIEFEIDEPYLEVSLTYCKDIYFSYWDFAADDHKTHFSYREDYITKVFELIIGDSTVIESSGLWDLPETFKRTLDAFLSYAKINIPSDVIMKLFDIYNGFLSNFTRTGIIGTIQRNEKLNCYIGQAFLGGQEDIYTKSFNNMRNKIKAVCSTNIEQLIANQLRHDIYFTYGSGIRCEVLCCTTLDQCNFSGGGSSTSLKHNASSAVALWHINNMKVLYPGDATIHTMYYMRTRGLLSYAKDCIMLAPHHGSGTTSGKASCGAGQDSWEELGYFLNGIQPSEIIISAGEENRHGHPNSSFIEKSEQALGYKATAKHNICYNTQRSGNKNRVYCEKEEEIALFTTVIYNAAHQTINVNCSLNISLTALMADDAAAAVEELKEGKPDLAIKEAKQLISDHRIKQKESGFRESGIDLNQVDFLEDLFAGGSKWS